MLKRATAADSKMTAIGDAPRRAFAQKLDDIAGKAVAALCHDPGADLVARYGEGKKDARAPVSGDPVAPSTDRGNVQLDEIIRPHGVPQ